jgi:hypothetical protein
MTDITRFKAIFSGLDIAYGTYKIESSRGDGKQAGKAVVVRKPPTDDLWTKHLQGVEPSLGIIPIRADNSCIWGCVDIDQYPLDHAGLIKKVRTLGLPMVVCRSKSGGAHVFLFTKAPIPASEMQRYLKASAALLGEAGREIFPKQSEILVDRGDTGNFLNLPYFGGDQTMRYAIKDDGNAATLEEFYELYEQWVQDPDLKFPEEPKAPDHPIKDGPPCLQALCAQGVPEGTRNNALFNIGIYLKKMIPIHWDDALVEHNQKYVSPPLPNNEVQLVVKQLHKKEYHYKCKDSPLNSFCNSGLCRTRKYGIGGNGPDAPQMSSLSTLRKQDWEGMLNALLKEMVETEQITEASEDTSITGRFNDMLEEFCTHLQQAMDRDEILMGRPWTDDDKARTYFRMKDLEAHLVRNNFKGMTHPKMAQRLRDLGGEPISLFLKNRTARCWSIPRFGQQDAPFETPEQRHVRSPF